MPKSGKAIGNSNSKLFQAVFPIIQTVDAHRKCRIGQFPNAFAASHRPYKWKGGEDRSWSSQGISKIKVVDIGSVKVDGFLHQAKTQNPCIEIYILLGISRDGRDVVDS